MVEVEPASQRDVCGPSISSVTGHVSSSQRLGEKRISKGSLCCWGTVCTRDTSLVTPVSYCIVALVMKMPSGLDTTHQCRQFLPHSPQPGPRPSFHPSDHTDRGTSPSYLMWSPRMYVHGWRTSLLLAYSFARCAPVRCG